MKAPRHNIGSSCRSTHGRKSNSLTAIFGVAAALLVSPCRGVQSGTAAAVDVKVPEPLLEEQRLVRHEPKRQQRETDDSSRRLSVEVSADGTPADLLLRGAESVLEQEEEKAPRSSRMQDNILVRLGLRPAHALGREMLEAALDTQATELFEEEISLDTANLDLTLNCTAPLDMNVNDTFQILLAASRRNFHLNIHEQHVYKEHFQQFMRYLVKAVNLTSITDVERKNGVWRKLNHLAFEAAKPVQTARMVRMVNDRGLTWKAEVNHKLYGLTWLEALILAGVVETKRVIASLAKPVGHAFLETASQRVENLMQEHMAAEEFDARYAWPHCAEVLGHIRDQGQCGSSWALAAAAVADSRLCIATDGKFSGISAKVSAGYIASCEGGATGNACDGGSPLAAFHFLGVHGAPTGGHVADADTCVPYFAAGTAIDHSVGLSASPPCPNECYNRHYPRSLQEDIFLTHEFQYTTTSTNPEEAKAAIRQHGPIAVAIHIFMDFFSYRSGVYHASSTRDLAGAHAMMAIGFGDGYILLANSWGRSWGEGGLVKVSTDTPMLFYIPGNLSIGSMDYPFPVPNGPGEEGYRGHHRGPGHKPEHGECRWVSTANCQQNGPPVPGGEKDCLSPIEMGTAGYCDCDGNGVKGVEEPGYECGTTPGTCYTACMTEGQKPHGVSPPATEPSFAPPSHHQHPHAHIVHPGAPASPKMPPSEAEPEPSPQRKHPLFRGIYPGEDRKREIEKEAEEEDEEEREREREEEEQEAEADAEAHHTQRRNSVQHRSGSDEAKDEGEVQAPESGERNETSSGEEGNSTAGEPEEQEKSAHSESSAKGAVTTSTTSTSSTSRNTTTEAAAAKVATTSTATTTETTTAPSEATNESGQAINESGEATNESGEATNHYESREATHHYESREATHHYEPGEATNHYEPGEATHHYEPGEATNETGEGPSAEEARRRAARRAARRNATTNGTTTVNTTTNDTNTTTTTTKTHEWQAPDFPFKDLLRRDDLGWYQYYYCDDLEEGETVAAWEAQHKHEGEGTGKGKRKKKCPKKEERERVMNGLLNATNEDVAPVLPAFEAAVKEAAVKEAQKGHDFAWRQGTQEHEEDPNDFVKPLPDEETESGRLHVRMPSIAYAPAPPEPVRIPPEQPPTEAEQGQAPQVPHQSQHLGQEDEDEREHQFEQEAYQEARLRDEQQHEDSQGISAASSSGSEEKEEEQLQSFSFPRPGSQEPEGNATASASGSEEKEEEQLQSFSFPRPGSQEPEGNSTASSSGSEEKEEEQLQSFSFPRPGSQEPEGTDGNEDQEQLQSFKPNFGQMPSLLEKGTTPRPDVDDLQVKRNFGQRPSLLEQGGSDDSGSEGQQLQSFQMPPTTAAPPPGATPVPGVDDLEDREQLQSLKPNFGQRPGLLEQGGDGVNTSYMSYGESRPTLGDYHAADTYNLMHVTDMRCERDREIRTSHMCHVASVRLGVKWGGGIDEPTGHPFCYVDVVQKVAIFNGALTYIHTENAVTDKYSICISADKPKQHYPFLGMGYCEDANGQHFAREAESILNAEPRSECEEACDNETQCRAFDNANELCHLYFGKEIVQASTLMSEDIIGEFGCWKKYPRQCGLMGSNAGPELASGPARTPCECRLHCMTVRDAGAWVHDTQAKSCRCLEFLAEWAESGRHFSGVILPNETGRDIPEPRQPPARSIPIRQEPEEEETLEHADNGVDNADAGHSPLPNTTANASGSHAPISEETEDEVGPADPTLETYESNTSNTSNSSATQSGSEQTSQEGDEEPTTSSSSTLSDGSQVITIGESSKNEEGMDAESDSVDEQQERSWHPQDFHTKPDGYLCDPASDIRSKPLCKAAAPFFGRWAGEMHQPGERSGCVMDDRRNVFFNGATGDYGKIFPDLYSLCMGEGTAIERAEGSMLGTKELSFTDLEPHQLCRSGVNIQSADMCHVAALKHNSYAGETSDTMQRPGCFISSSGSIQFNDAKPQVESSDMYPEGRSVCLEAPMNHYVDLGTGLCVDGRMNEPLPAHKEKVPHGPGLDCEASCSQHAECVAFENHSSACHLVHQFKVVMASTDVVEMPREAVHCHKRLHQDCGAVGHLHGVPLDSPVYARSACHCHIQCYERGDCAGYSFFVEHHECQLLSNATNMVHDCGGWCLHGTMVEYNRNPFQAVLAATEADNSSADTPNPDTMRQTEAIECVRNPDCNVNWHCEDDSHIEFCEHHAFHHCPWPDCKQVPEAAEWSGPGEGRRRFFSRAKFPNMTEGLPTAEVPSPSVPNPLPWSGSASSPETALDRASQALKKESSSTTTTTRPQVPFVLVVTSGRCRQQEDCVMSPSWPSSYGANEECEIEVHTWSGSSYMEVQYEAASALHEGDDAKHRRKARRSNTGAAGASGLESDAFPWHRVASGEHRHHRHDLLLEVQSFATERGHDFLTVNGVPYSGTTGPHGVKPSGTIYWSSDGDTSGHGFRICVNQHPEMPALNVQPSEWEPPLGLTDDVYQASVWAVVPGPRGWPECRIDSDYCITSPMYPNPYLPGSECKIMIAKDEEVELQVLDFETEALFDTLQINEERYSGTDMPPPRLKASGLIIWTTDATLAARGWKICPKLSRTTTTTTPCEPVVMQHHYAEQQATTTTTQHSGALRRAALCTTSTWLLALLAGAAWVSQTSAETR